MGVLLGRSHTAARDIGIPMVPTAVLQRWAVDESNRRLAENHEPKVLERIAHVLRMLEVDIWRFPFVLTKDGLITGEQVAERAMTLKTAYIVQDASYHNAVRNSGAFDLNDDVLIADVGRTPVLGGRFMRSNHFVEWPAETKAEGWGDHQFYARSLAGAVIEALAKGWGCSLKSVVQASSFSTDEKPYSAEIGKRSGTSVLDYHLQIIRKPSS